MSPDDAEAGGSLRIAFVPIVILVAVVFFLVLFLFLFLFGFLS